MARAEPGGPEQAGPDRPASRGPHRPASRGPQPGRASADVPPLLVLTEVQGAAAGRGTEAEAWTQAAWGWGAVTGRTPHGALTPGPTALLPPHARRILYLFWPLIFLPPE